MRAATADATPPHWRRAAAYAACSAIMYASYAAAALREWQLQQQHEQAPRRTQVAAFLLGSVAAGGVAALLLRGRLSHRTTRALSILSPLPTMFCVSVSVSFFWLPLHAGNVPANGTFFLQRMYIVGLLPVLFGQAIEDHLPLLLGLVVPAHLALDVAQQFSLAALASGSKGAGGHPYAALGLLLRMLAAVAGLLCLLLLMSLFTEEGGAGVAPGPSTAPADGLHITCLVGHLKRMLRARWQAAHAADLAFLWRALAAFIVCIQIIRVSEEASSSPAEVLFALLMGVGLGSLDGNDMAQALFAQLTAMTEVANDLVPSHVATMLADQSAKRHSQETSNKLPRSPRGSVSPGTGGSARGGMSHHHGQAVRRRSAELPRPRSSGDATAWPRATSLDVGSHALPPRRFTHLSVASPLAFASVSVPSYSIMCSSPSEQQHAAPTASGSNALSPRHTSGSYASSPTLASAASAPLCFLGWLGSSDSAADPGDGNGHKDPISSDGCAPEAAKDADDGFRLSMMMPGATVPPTVPVTTPAGDTRAKASSPSESSVVCRRPCRSACGAPPGDGRAHHISVAGMEVEVTEDAHQLPGLDLLSPVEDGQQAPSGGGGSHDATHLSPGTAEHFALNADVAFEGGQEQGNARPSDGSVRTSGHSAAGGEGSTYSRDDEDAQQPLLAFSHSAVTVLFADIVGFTTLSKDLEPLQVFRFLNELYARFDSVVDNHRVYKVETIGDCYMCATGLLKDDPEHAAQMVRFACEMQRQAAQVLMPDGSGLPVRVRVGIHSGPLLSGVIGHIRKRYCVVGSTVNLASRMESTGIAGRVHVSADTHALVEDLGGEFCWECRGEVGVKGVGPMVTYLLQQE